MLLIFPTSRHSPVALILVQQVGIELAFDERDKAEAMSAAFKTEHYEMVLKSGDMERCLDQLTGILRNQGWGKVTQTFTPPNLPVVL